MAKLFLIFRVVIKGHIMMIALVFTFSAIGAAIAAPCPIKEPAAIPGGERAELCYCNLQIGENRFQPCFDGGRYTRPIGWQWIKARESLKNRAAEFYRSGTPSVQFPNIKESPNTEHTYNNTGNAGKDRIVLAWQWRVLPFAGLIPIIMYLVDSIYRMAHPSTKDSFEP